MKKFKKTVVLSVAVAELAAFVANSSFVNRSALAFLNKKLDSKNVGVFKKFKNCENVLSEKKKSSKRCKNKVNRDLFNIIKKYLKKYEVFLCCFSTSLVFSILSNCLVRKIIDNAVEVNEQEKEKIEKKIKDVSTNTTQHSESRSEDKVVPGPSEDLYKESPEQINEEMSKKLVVKKVCVSFYILLVIWFLLALKIIKHHEDEREAREQERFESKENTKKPTIDFVPMTSEPKIFSHEKDFPEPKNVLKGHNGEEINIIDYPYKPGSISMPKISKWNNPIISGDTDEGISDEEVVADPDYDSDTTKPVKDQNEPLFPDFFNQVKNILEREFNTINSVTCVNNKEMIFFQMNKDTLKIVKSSTGSNDYRVYSNVDNVEKKVNDLDEENAKNIFLQLLSDFIVKKKYIAKNYSYKNGKIIEENIVNRSLDNIINNIVNEN